MISLSDLVTPKAAADWQTQCLAALQGIGYVEQSGISPGTCVASGLAVATYDVALTILTAGELGVATYSYTLIDTGGNLVFTSTPATLGGSGIVTILDASSNPTGLTMTFAAAATAVQPSFLAADTFSVSIANPAFPVSSWGVGGVGLTLVQLQAMASADLDQTIARIAQGGFLAYAKGPWLTLLALNVFGLSRKEAQTASGNMQLTLASGAGPYTFTAGQITVSDAAGHQFANTAGGTLSSVTTPLTLAFEAVSPGAAWNEGGSAITILVTSFAGVTVNNGSAFTGGTDAESDPALVARCQDRWPSLGTGATAAQYELWALTASDSVTSVNVIADPTIPGQVDIYLAGSGGSVSGGVVSAVQTYINPLAPLCVSPVVASATPITVTITATITVHSADLTTAQAQATVNLNSYFENLPVGGQYVPGLPAGKTGIASMSAILSALASCAGVVDVAMSSPSADTNLTASQAATYSETLTWVTI